MDRLQQLIEDAVAALTALDAYALEQIRLEVLGLPVVQLPSVDLAAVVSSHRLLGALLHETERNLKLFQASSPTGLQGSEAGCYASPPR